MQANRRRDTKPELAIRRILHARGLRYRTDVRPDRSIRRHADIVFTKAKIAVFVDGCFWHGCPEHFIPPKANADYWAQKIEGNQMRDADTNDVLTA
ncbi:very short patch repair endonuclease, partial [Brevibacterium paucivorans]